MISEVQLARSTDYMTYKESFARRFAQLLLEYDAQPFVVQSVGAEFLRRYFVPHDTIVTVHLFKDPAHLAQVRRDRESFLLLFSVAARGFRLRTKSAKNPRTSSLSGET